MGSMVSRRTLGGILAGAGLGAMATPRGAAQDAALTATPFPEGISFDGVAGGGTLTHMGVEVPFSLLAFSMPAPDGDPVVVGFLRLVDESTLNHPLRIEATEIISVDPLPAQSTAGRQIIGFGTLNMNGRYPFMLQVEDLGGPGSGEDTFNLVFGKAAAPFLEGKDASGCDCGGLGYAIRSNVTRGDLSVLRE